MWKLLVLGVSLGFVHVLSGPDHLSALAALSVGTSYRAFALGVRWGVGHSSGLVLVAVVFIALRGDLDLRRLGRYCDLLVGVFMVGLGAYGVLAALRMYRAMERRKDPAREQLLPSSPKGSQHNSENRLSDDSLSFSAAKATESQSLTQSPRKPSTGSEDIFIGLEENPLLSQQISHESSLIIGSANNSNNDNSNALNENCRTIDVESAQQEESDDMTHKHDHMHCLWCPFVDIRDPRTQRIVSLCIGLLHGVAGPGGILGVLPAVEMQRASSSALYLGSFIVSSTLCMGVFAAVYGEATKRLGATTETMELWLSVVSAVLSIGVGVLWIVLSALGKLDEIFE